MPLALLGGSFDPRAMGLYRPLWRARRARRSGTGLLAKHRHWWPALYR